MPSPRSGLRREHVSARPGSFAEIISSHHDPPDLDAFRDPYFTVGLSESPVAGSGSGPGTRRQEQTTR